MSNNHKTERMFQIWTLKLLSLHKLIHFYKDIDDLLNEEYYLDKFFNLYDHLTKVYGQERVDNSLKNYALHKKQILPKK